MSPITTVSELPLGRCGVAELTRRTPSKLDVMIARQPLSERPVTQLMVNRQLVMSDGDNEYYTNLEFVRRCHGKVLVAGLGIGLILKQTLSKESVEHITVIEKCDDVITLVAPHYWCDKLTVVYGDILDWKPSKNSRFNVIYFDIWPNICTDNLKQITSLHRRFSRYLDRSDPACWMGSWEHQRLKKGRR